MKVSTGAVEVVPVSPTVVVCDRDVGKSLDSDVRDSCGRLPPRARYWLPRDGRDESR